MTIPPKSDLRAHLLNFSLPEQDAIATGKQKLFRIFPFHRFIDVVRNNKLAFVKPTLWDDPYENLLIGREITDLDGTKFTCPAYANSYYAQCWFLPPESDGMWRIYSHDKSGILVECDTARLYQSVVASMMHPIQQLYIGRIIYLEEIELKARLEDPDFLQSVVRAKSYRLDGNDPLFLKRDAFVHEKEVRLILQDSISRDPTNVLHFSISVEELIPRVWFDPRLRGEDFDRYRYILEAVGYTGEILQSKLYNVPDLSLRINNLIDP
jgi:hypothetical protein